MSNKVANAASSFFQSIFFGLLMMAVISVLLYIYVFFATKWKGEEISSLCKNINVGSEFKYFFEKNQDKFLYENKEKNEYGFQGGDISCTVHVLDGKIVSASVFDPSKITRN